MARVKIDFERKPVPQQIEISRHIQKKMAGNSHFLLPDPDLATIKTTTDRLEQSFIEASRGDLNKKAEMRLRRAELKELISRLAYYVQHASKGNEEIILSSGFSVRKKKEKAVVPFRPEGLKVKPAVREGELELVWTAVKGATFYIIAICSKELNLDSFELRTVSQKARVTISGLQGVERYWFRVAAANAAGVSGWSDPVMGVAV